MYLMNLLNVDKFCSRAGSCWRLLFVFALFPWLTKYRVLTRSHMRDDDECVAADLDAIDGPESYRSLRNYNQTITSSRALSAFTSQFSGEEEKQLDNEVVPMDSTARQGRNGARLLSRGSQPQDSEFSPFLRPSLTKSFSSRATQNSTFNLIMERDLEIKKLKEEIVELKKKIDL